MAFNSVVFVQISVILLILRQCDALPQSRIINGNPVSRNQFPWHVLINSTRADNFRRYCGGSLIAPNFVLTAASCIDNSTTIKIDAGIVSFYNATETQYSSLYRLHPNYDPRNGFNDIAIIKLDRNFTYRDNVRSIMLPGYSHVNNSFVYQQCYFTGFGMTNETEFSMSPDLRYSSNVVIPNEYCKEHMNRERVDMCAVSYESSVCHGDQGGGLVSVVSGWMFQIGLLANINSNGCINGIPHIYTKITDHLDWIAYLTGLTFDY